MWDRGVHEPALARRPPLRWLGVATVVAALVLVTAVAGRGADGPRSLGFGAARGGTPAAGEPGEGGQPEREGAQPEPEVGSGEEGPAGPVRPEHLYTLDGREPEAFPDDVAGLAFLALDDPVSAAYQEFGPPQERRPDINDTVAHVWFLPHDAEIAVVATGEDPDDPVLGLIAEVPEASGVRFAAHGGVVVGRSTPAEVTAAWGPGFDRSEHPGDDFVVRYTLCRGPWPVVVKFDQPDGASWTGAPVTRVLIAYTDDGPQAAGCPAS